MDLLNIKRAEAIAALLTQHGYTATTEGATHHDEKFSVAHNQMVTGATSSGYHVNFLFDGPPDSASIMCDWVHLGEDGSVELRWNEPSSLIIRFIPDAASQEAASLAAVDINRRYGQL